MHCKFLEKEENSREEEYEEYEEEDGSFTWFPRLMFSLSTFQLFSTPILALIFAS